MDDHNCTTEEFFRFENDPNYFEPDWDDNPPSFFQE